MPYFCIASRPEILHMSSPLKTAFSILPHFLVITNLCENIYLELARYTSCYSHNNCTRAFGPRYGESYLWQLKFKKLSLQQNIGHVMLALIKSESIPITSNYPSRQFCKNKPPFCKNFEFCPPFSRKQQQIFITCC